MTPASTTHWSNVDLMLSQRPRRWPNIKSTLGYVLCLPGRSVKRWWQVLSLYGDRVCHGSVTRSWSPLPPPVVVTIPRGGIPLVPRRYLPSQGSNPLPPPPRGHTFSHLCHVVYVHEHHNCPGCKKIILFTPQPQWLWCIVITRGGRAVWQLGGRAFRNSALTKKLSDEFCLFFIDMTYVPGQFIPYICWAL